MDDFLYNLRRETDKRNRRQGGQQQQYRGPDRRGPKDQRRGGYQKRNDATSELLPEIKSLLETLNENQKKLVDNDKRKTLALENIAASLQMMSGNTEPLPASVEDSAPEAPVATGVAAEAVTEAPAAEVAEVEMPQAEVAEAVSEAKPEAVASETDGGETGEAPARSTREEVRKIALELRDKGMTYKEIAKHLDDEKVPTFSGKGGWHAPTIHKLCK